MIFSDFLGFKVKKKCLIVVLVFIFLTTGEEENLQKLAGFSPFAEHERAVLVLSFLQPLELGGLKITFKHFII